MVERPIYNLDGEIIGKIELPSVFNRPVRLDLIRRAYLSTLTSSRQPKGTDPNAGKRTSARSWGVGRGLARVPRIRGEHHPTVGRGAFAPGTVGGRTAHPPRTDKRLEEKINKKEKRLAMMSAISATADKEIVRSRGHRIPGEFETPLIISKEIESLSKTNQVKKLLDKLGLSEELKRCKDRWGKIRAGRGKMRGRKRQRAKGPLIIVSKDDGIVKAARNIPGVDVKLVDLLSVKDLCPGGVPGRLTIWSETAIREIGDRFA
uniref:Large ribosomal subunit protein uL4 n=1 Tax=uncultured korarchaeote TaxID=161241 RepID=A0A1L2JME1_9CREN|nr:ribosomal protein L4 [uncultured korarchaeote]